MLIKITTGTVASGINLAGTPISSDRIYYVQATGIYVETDLDNRIIALREEGGAAVLNRAAVQTIEYGNLTDGGYFRSILSSRTE